MEVKGDQFGIEQLIVHELPIATADGKTKPRLSDLPSPNDKKVVQFFETRAARALTKDGSDVVFTAGESPMPKIIKALAHDASPDLVGLSKEAASYLFKIQGRNVSPGLLTVGLVKYQGVRGVLLTKLEKTQGVDIKEDTVDGKVRLSIGHVPNLMLTDTTRIFKIALFIATRSGGVLGCVCDSQASAYATHQVADFFLAKYLSCALKERPDLSTQKFFLAAQSFINGLDDPERQAEYQIGLLAELNSQEKEVKPQDFAARVMIKKHQQPFIEAVKKNGLQTSSIKKDVKLIAPKLKRTRFLFEHDMTLIGTPESIQQHVDIGKDETGATQVTITDEIERFE